VAHAADPLLSKMIVSFGPQIAFPNVASLTIGIS